MRLGSCTYQQCGKPARLKYERVQLLCADHVKHCDVLNEERAGLRVALRICRDVNRRMPERDRVALRVAIEKIRAKLRRAKSKKGRRA